MINTIQSALEKKGQKFIDNFFNSKLIISEKLDLFRIIFIKKNGQLYFFKKDNSIIDRIELILNDIWLKPINFILNKKELIPENLYFGISFFNPSNYKIIPYENLNKLIITDISIRENNKIIKKFSYDEILPISYKLDMLPPPIIFDGYLNSEQKKILLDYINNDTKLILSDIINNFFKPFSKFPLVKGLILETNKNLLQIESHEFNLLSQSYEREFNVNRVFYDILIIELINFLKNFNWDIKFVDNTYDKKYISLINKIFLEFVESFNIGEIDKQYLNPKYLNDNITQNLINNKKVVDKFKENDSYPYVYKIILNSLRKEKKPFAMLTENNIEEFNFFVKKIKNMIYDKN